MSSSYAIDSAWSHLRNDDKIEKVLPLAALAVPALMGAYGAYTGAGGRFTDDQGNFNLNMGGNAKMVDPITGGYIAEKELGSSFGDRLLGGAVGATQAINPFGAVRGAGAALRGAGVAGAKLGARRAGSRLAARGANADAARRARGATEAVGDVGPVSQFRGVEGFRSPVPGVPDVATITPAMQHQAALSNAATQGGQIGAGLQTRAAQNFQRFGQSPTRFTPNMKVHAPIDRTALGVGNKLAVLGRATQVGGPVLGALAGLGMNEFGDNATVDPNTSGFGGHGGASSFGSGQYGMGAQGTGDGGFGGADNFDGVNNQNSNLTDRRSVWGEEGFGSGTENTGQFNQQITTGENMKIGERMLKQAENMMYKAVCPKCGKADCKCDDKKKAEDCPNCGKVSKMCGCENTKKADKKPSHGMVIVIGSKAGPGPSKNGKREKLDSEKDKKEE